jgi:tRNA (mo5U34)-methyltransferase
MTTTPISHDELEKRIKSFPFWYHKIALPGGIVTPGFAPLSPPSYRVPESLAGKRVLDIGAWDGYWSFEALRRGAREVVAIDDFSDLLGSINKDQRRGWETFDLCREALGYGEDRCKRIDMSVYDLSEEKLGRFDVVFFFGTLYHLRHPLLALDKISGVCDDEIYVESAILDDYSPYRGGLGKGYPKEMVMEFYPGKEYANNESNWWVPSLLCLGHMVHSAGFSTTQVWKLTDNVPGNVATCRGHAHGQKKRGALD